MERKTGVVIPLSALYTKDCVAVGDFLALKDFADFAQKASLSVIQLLPVNDTGTQSSPYSGLSAYALHPLYLRIAALPEFDDAYKHDKTFAAAYRAFKKAFPYTPRFDYEQVLSKKIELLHLLYSYLEKKMSGKLKKKKAPAKTEEAAKSEAPAEEEKKELTPDELTAKFNSETGAFVRANKWVPYYAVFKDLKDSASQASWKNWPEEFRHLTRKQIMLRWENRAHRSSHYFFVWCQMRAHEQFKEAADYVKEKGITLKGDLPVLLNDDSADCWAWPEYFNQDMKAGAPPSGDTPLGQNWGFPTYGWKNIAADNFNWWKDRVRSAAQYYGAFRIDHILGFFRIWCVRKGESTAYLGHTEPYAAISRETLEKEGFDTGRLNWLSKPHIPTGLIEDITWNHDEATDILEQLCDRVGTEELWNFKKEIETDGDIYRLTLSSDGGKDGRIKEALAAKWRDRALIEITPDNFIPVYSYRDSTAWKSLSWDEQQKLQNIFAKNKEAENALWKKQALDVLTPICKETGMTACAEDLGVNLACMPEVLNSLDILSLKVIRWNRAWEKDGQPYVPFADYPETSVCTTSVHDSSTLRQWWNGEKDSVRAYLSMAADKAVSYKDDAPQADAPFDETVAAYCLKTSAQTGSAWFINPLQDYLYLKEDYYKENPDDERINVPGSVNSFNWTYRMPYTISEIAKDKLLVSRIKEAAKIHDEQTGRES